MEGYKAFCYIHGMYKDGFLCPTCVRDVIKDMNDEGPTFSSSMYKHTFRRHGDKLGRIEDMTEYDLKFLKGCGIASEG
jgi:hypothetical protein